MPATRIAATGTSKIWYSRGPGWPGPPPVRCDRTALDPLQRDRVYVPGIPADVRDRGDAKVVRRVKAMVHAGCQPQGDEAAIAEGCRQGCIGQQVIRAYGTLDLQHLAVLDPPAGADDGVTGTDQNRRVGIDGPGAVFQFAGEAIMHAAEPRLLCVGEVEVGEVAPDLQRQVADDGGFDAAEPADEPRRQAARQAVRQQEVHVFLLHNLHYVCVKSHDIAALARRKSGVGRYVYDSNVRSRRRSRAGRPGAGTEGPPRSFPRQAPLPRRSRSDVEASCIPHSVLRV